MTDAELREALHELTDWAFAHWRASIDAAPFAAAVGLVRLLHDSGMAMALGAEARALLRRLEGATALARAADGVDGEPPN